MKAQIIDDTIVSFGIALEGENVFEPIPDDYSYDKYNYTPSIAGVFDPNGFTLKTIIADIDFQKRQYNIQRMNGYMSLQVTQSALDVFLSDTATHVQGYLNGGSRLITWIETVSRNGYNATNIGFKTKTAYRGTSIDGIYERAETILNILNDL